MLEMRAEAWLYAGFWDLPHLFSGIGVDRPDSGREEKQLVILS
jgi:hypothetical protein